MIRFVSSLTFCLPPPQQQPSSEQRSGQWEGGTLQRRRRRQPQQPKIIVSLRSGHCLVSLLCVILRNQFLCVSDLCCCCCCCCCVAYAGSFCIEFSLDATRGQAVARQCGSSKNNNNKQAQTCKQTRAFSPLLPLEQDNLSLS